MTLKVGVLFAFTVSAIILDVSVPTAQFPLAVMTQLTASLLAKLLLLYAGLFVPVFAPFNSHWYVGAFPALIAVAEKLTGEPVQIFVAEEVIVAVGETVGLITTIVFAVSEVQLFASVAMAIQVPEYAVVTLLKTAVLVKGPPPRPATGFFII
jgi:hypothetical protein